jgi:hypothetical protein
MDIPIQDKPASSGAQATASSGAQAAASAVAQMLPSREALDGAYKSVKDSFGNIMQTINSFKNRPTYITSTKKIEPQYKEQIKMYGTPEAVMNEEIRVAGSLIGMLSPTPSYTEVNQNKPLMRNIDNSLKLIEYARQQMETEQEYQDTRQAQALGMSSLASGPVRMPGLPITYAPQQQRSERRTPSRSRNLSSDIRTRIGNLGMTPVERNPLFQTQGQTPPQRQTEMTPQGVLVPVLSGLTTPPRRSRGATSRTTSEPPSTGLSTGLARLLEEDQGTIVPSGSGRYKGGGKAKAKAKGKARLKPIREEVVELIKPAKNHLSYIDLNNDPYLINKIR